MFTSPAYAQAAGGTPGGFDFVSLLPLVLIFVVFWFLLIRPQQKKVKQHREMIAAMRLLLEHARLAVEPAGAASTAALFGPLRERLAGRRVGLIVCGSNISADAYNHLIMQ